MDKAIISKYTQLFDTLGLDTKLELLSKLTESIQKGFKKKGETETGTPKGSIDSLMEPVDTFDSVIQPVNPSISIEQMKHDQQYRPINRQEFYKKAAQIEINEPLEDLLSMLD